MNMYTPKTLGTQLTPIQCDQHSLPLPLYTLNTVNLL